MLSVIFCFCVGFVASAEDANKIKRPPILRWGQTPAKISLESRLSDASSASVQFTNTTITISAEPYYVQLALLRPINVSASSFVFSDGRLSVSAAKTRREPCWMRLLADAATRPAWLSIDHGKVDLEGCQFYRELWRSEYFTNLLDDPKSQGNSML
jgi:hypothetical protein